MTSEIQSKTIVCTLPASLDVQVFKDFMARKIETYYAQASLDFEEGGVCRVGLSCSNQYMDEVVASISEKVGGWGGRVEEPSTPGHSPKPRRMRR